MIDRNVARDPDIPVARGSTTVLTGLIGINLVRDPADISLFCHNWTAWTMLSLCSCSAHRTVISTRPHRVGQSVQDRHCTVHCRWTSKMCEFSGTCAMLQVKNEVVWEHRSLARSHDQEGRHETRGAVRCHKGMPPIGIEPSGKGPSCTTIGQLLFVRVACSASYFGNSGLQFQGGIQLKRMHLFPER